MQSQFQGIDNKEKLCFFTNLYAINPFTDKDIPIVFTNYVLMGYGTGAVFGCPAHDKRDFEFAEKYNFKILNVIEPTPNREQNLPYVDIEEDAKLVNSNFLNGLNPKRAQEKIIEKIKEKKIGGIKQSLNSETGVFQGKDIGGAQFPLFTERTEKLFL